MPITQYENYEQWRDATESLDTLIKAENRVGALVERRAILSTVELIRHDVPPEANDLHYMQGYLAALERCLAHIGRRE